MAGRATEWWKSKPPAIPTIPATIPATIEHAPVYIVLNAPLPRPLPPVLPASSALLTVLLPLLVPLSSLVAAASKGRGGEARVVAAAPAVGTVDAAVVNISILNTVIIGTAIPTGIASTHPAIIIVIKDGDVAVVSCTRVVRDSPPLFALLFVPTVRACWQKALLGGNPYPALLSPIVESVRRSLLNGDAASADGAYGRGANGGAGGRDRPEEGIRRVDDKGSREEGSGSVPSVAPSSPGPILIDAVPVVAVSHVVFESNHPAVGSAAAQAVDVEGRLGAGRGIPRGAEIPGGRGTWNRRHTLSSVAAVAGAARTGRCPAAGKVVKIRNGLAIISEIAAMQDCNGATHPVTNGSSDQESARALRLHGTLGGAAEVALRDFARSLAATSGVGQTSVADSAEDARGGSLCVGPSAVADHSCRQHPAGEVNHIETGRRIPVFETHKPSPWTKGGRDKGDARRSQR